MSVNFWLNGQQIAGKPPQRQQSGEINQIMAEMERSI
jgi:hypothetical protein